MSQDEEFAYYLQGITKPETDRDFVRRNYDALKETYLRTGVVKLPEADAPAAQGDRYGELD